MAFSMLKRSAPPPLRDDGPAPGEFASVQGADPPRRAAGDTTNQGATGGPRGGSAPTPRVARRLGKIVTADAQQPPPPPTKFTAISEWDGRPDILFAG